MTSTVEENYFRTRHVKVSPSDIKDASYSSSRLTGHSVVSAQLVLCSQFLPDYYLASVFQTLARGQPCSVRLSELDGLMDWMDKRLPVLMTD